MFKLEYSSKSENYNITQGISRHRSEDTRGMKIKLITLEEDMLKGVEDGKRE